MLSAKLNRQALELDFVFIKIQFSSSNSLWTLILMQWGMNYLDTFTGLLAKQINRMQDNRFDAYLINILGNCDI